jgi:tetratricopeptide (TPR) repeat protein
MHRTADTVLILFLLALLGLPLEAAPQDPPKPDALPAPESAPAGAPSIVFERQHMRVRIEADGRGTRTMTMHVRANDDAGVRQAGQIPLVYAPSSDDLAIQSLAVHKADGRVITAGPEAVQDHAIQPSAQIPMFIDLRQKTVTVPALQPGDTVAITAVWTVARPLAERHGWFEHSFVKHAVVTDERLEIDVPAAMQPIILMGASSPAELNGGEGRVSGDRRVYVWQASNPVVAEDDETPPEEEPVADVRITTFPDWKVFAGWLGPLMQPRADDAVRAKAVELTKGLTDRAAKIDAIYHYVATQIRYVSLSFGLNRYAPHAPGEVLKNEYGDCKDKHALMAAMLREIGVDAVPVLLNTARSISEDMPSPTEFDHVITAIPGNAETDSWQWFDTTLEIAPAGLLAPTTRDRLALSLGDERRAPRLVTTPRDGPVPSLDTTDVQGKINPLGLLTADVRLTTRGDTELVLRAAARGLPREMLEEFGKGFARALGFDGEVSGFSFSDPLATREPFEVRFAIRQAAFLDWAADSSTVGVVLGKLETSGLDPEQTPLKKDRKVGSTAALRRTFVVRLPPGYVAAKAPVGVRAAKDDFAYTSTYTVDETYLRAERTLEGQPRVLVVEHASDYSRIARSITADLGQKFTIQRFAPVKPSIPEDMTARELYSAGYSAFTAKDYETSIAIWQRAAEKDPKLSTPLNGLGLAYQRLKRYDEAVAALEKVRELEPTNKKINADLGFVYKEAGRRAEAAEAYARHLATSPLDGATHKILAELYLDLGRHAEGLEAIDKALPLVKEDPWLHQLRGRALLGLGRREEAVEAFDSALAGDATPAMTSSIAWILADANVDDARVLDLSSQAIEAIRGEMRGVVAVSLSASHFRLMERLAWAWDARGLVHMRAGRLEQAIDAFEAAWQLGITSATALHLAQAYEKKDRLVDAATYFLTARMLDSTPGPELVAGLSRHYKGLDIDTLIDAARRHTTGERLVKVPGSGPDGTEIDLNAVLDSTGKVIDTGSLGESKAPPALLAAIGRMTFPITAPGTGDFRLAARVRAVCRGGVCYASVAPPRAVK